MSCKNCPPVDYTLRTIVKNWLGSGYDVNKIAAIVGCSLDLIYDVQANGVGEDTTQVPAPEVLVSGGGEEEVTEEEAEEIPALVNEPEEE